MSKIALKANDSGTGTFEIQAPATNTNRVLELPDEAGKVLTDVGVPTSAMPAGSVIQVVSKTFNDTTNTTSSSFVDVTNSDLSITPSSASSKILITYSLTYRFRPDNGSQTARVKIIKNNSVDLYESVFLSINLARQTISLVMQYLDSPETISSVTYKAQTLMLGGTNVVVNDNAGDSSVTLMEIAG